MFKCRFGKYKLFTKHKLCDVIRLNNDRMRNIIFVRKVNNILKEDRRYWNIKNGK